jgi:Flp pilus assembly protein TadG
MNPSRNPNERARHWLAALSRPGSDGRRDDDGRVALLVLVLTLAVLAMIGLSVDGGGKVRALERADNLAAEAARAAGQALQGSQAIQGGPKVIDPRTAVTAAYAYLAAAGVPGTVVVWPDRRHVTVTVTITYHPVFLPLVGIGTLTATRHATAVLVTT